MRTKGTFAFLMLIICLSNGGELLHAAGPVTEKTLFLNSVLVHSTSNDAVDVVENCSAAHSGRKLGLESWRCILDRNRSLQHASVEKVCILYEN